jgi:hypothetical protein
MFVQLKLWIKLEIFIFTKLVRSIYFNNKRRSNLFKQNVFLCLFAHSIFSSQKKVLWEKEKSKSSAQCYKILH